MNEVPPFPPFVERSILFGHHILLPKPDPRLPPAQQCSLFSAHKTTPALWDWKNFPTYQDALDGRTSQPIPANKFPDTFLKLEAARTESVFAAVAWPCENKLSIQYLNPKKFNKRVIAIRRTYKMSDTLYMSNTSPNSTPRFTPFTEILDADNHKHPISIEFILKEGITIGFGYRYTC